MPEDLVTKPPFLLIVSLLVLASIAVRLGVHRLKLPPVVGYIALGLGLRYLNQQYAFLDESSVWTLNFFADLGVVSLLFHVGLRSDLSGLLEQLPRASVVWVCDVAVSAAIGFWGARLLGFDVVPALFAGTALSATSVSVSVSVWEEAKAIQSRMGELLLDVAELDDLSAIVLLVVTLAVAPALIATGHADGMAAVVLKASGMVILKLALFAAGCWLFSLHLEARITGYFARFRKAPEPLLAIVGFGFGIAALAGWLGFSVAVGALFAGLMFSRDQEAVNVDAGFGTIYALFTPFFFINIGYGFDPTVFGSAATLGLFVFVAAVLGKVLGVGAPVAVSSGLEPALLLGVSMVPRAEIALLVMQTGNQMGPKYVPPELYGAVVLAAAAASIGSPLALFRLLEKWPGAVDLGRKPAKG
ncbi:MAG: cation:proton antiporter [Acidobacteria bacterium]|nr:cation:proton antiporter [Acidobacteriota bacterium]